MLTIVIHEGPDPPAENVRVQIQFGEEFGSWNKWRFAKPFKLKRPKNS
jgi:hypothetical protein